MSVSFSSSVRGARKALAFRRCRSRNSATRVLPSSVMLTMVCRLSSGDCFRRIYPSSSNRASTSVRDCGILLEKLYRGQCVSEEYDKKIINLLKKQERRWKIPSGLPEDIEIANKTGETSDIELDTAIVYSDRCDFVLCIAVTDFCSNTVYGEFGELACMVYEFLNN